MPVNKENAQKLLDFISARPAELVIMSTWVQTVGEVKAEHGTLCGTAGCLAGHANMVQALEAGHGQIMYMSPEYGELSPKAIIADPRKPGFFTTINLNSPGLSDDWLGLDYYRAEALFKMSEVRGHDGLSALTIFDSKSLTPDERKASMVKVVEILRDTGLVDWDTALRSVLGEDRWDRLFNGDSSSDYEYGDDD